MTVYVDDMRMQATVPNGNRKVSGRWSHLMADTEEELIDFAVNKLGMRESWIQHRGEGHVHFDVVDSRREAALRLGAVSLPCRSPEWMAFFEKQAREDRRLKSAAAKPKRMDMDTVVRFANARHRLWEGKSVKSPILQTRKFTNVFRVLDRGSQYLLQLMNLHDDPLDRLALSYFYRQVNRPDTMDAIIERNDGYVPEARDIFDPKWYSKVIAPVLAARPGAFLNGAYIILIKPGDSRGTLDKMADVFPAARPHLATVAQLTELEARVRALQKTPGQGPFLAMQIATDLGYCKGEPDQENDYVLAGPGSRLGVGIMLGKDAPASPREAYDVITTFPYDRLPALPMSNGRGASWMDIQNVFCEFSKYARLVRKGDKGTGQPYQRHEEFLTLIPKQFVLK
jgi:hypothetical protein